MTTCFCIGHYALYKVLAGVRRYIRRRPEPGVVVRRLYVGSEFGYSDPECTLPYCDKYGKCERQ